MSRPIVMIATGALAVIAVIASSSLFVVNQAEQALVLRLGVRPILALPAHREHELGYFCAHAGAAALVTAADPSCRVRQSDSADS